MMDKLKFYKITSLALVIVNLGLLAFIVWSPRPNGRPPLRANNPLELSDAQQDQFQELAKGHQLRMREHNDEQRTILKDYFEQLMTETPVAEVPLPEEVLQLEERKIMGTYQHLLEVKDILTPEQADRYPDFVRRALQRILLDDDRPKPRRKGPEK